jgi:hypothetical protein
VYFYTFDHLNHLQGSPLIISDLATKSKVSLNEPGE